VCGAAAGHVTPKVDGLSGETTWGGGVVSPVGMRFARKLQLSFGMIFARGVRVLWLSQILSHQIIKEIRA